MPKLFKYTGIILSLVIIACGITYFADDAKYTEWEMEIDDTTLAWTPFEWAADSMGNRYYNRAALLILCRVEGVPNVCTFQLDTGADMTGVYEHTFASLYGSHPGLADKIRRLKSPLQFWNGSRAFENFTLYFGSYKGVNKYSRFYEGYGEPAPALQPGDTLHLGTIGADFFKGRTVIIDYPNKQFAICNRLPAKYAGALSAMELDTYGRPVLPATLGGRHCRVLFDTGSSIFPIITTAPNINSFSTSPDTDTIQVSSWGKLHNVTGRKVNKSITIGGRQYNNIMAYANHSGEGADTGTDAIVGNAMFWDKVVILDFKNRRFGIK